MGCGYSKMDLPQVPATFPFFCIYFTLSDRIRVIHADTPTLDTLRNLINEYLTITRERMEYGITEFKVKGFPFTPVGGGKELAVNLRWFICNLIKQLHAVGQWEVLASSDLSRGEFDNDSLIFYRYIVPSQSVKIENGITDVVSIGISSHDSLHFVGLQDRLMNRLLEVGKQNFFANRDKKEYTIPYTKCNAMGLKYPGYPWLGDQGSNVLQGRYALLALLNEMDKEKYEFHGVANPKGSSDSLYFVRRTTPKDIYNSYWMMTFDKHDSLCLLNVPNGTGMQIATIDTVRQAVAAFYPIKSDATIDSWPGSWKFRTKGSPWWADGGEAVRSRALVLVIIQTLRAIGWEVCQKLDTSRGPSDKSVLIMRACMPEQVEMMAVSLNMDDCIRLIGGTEANTAKMDQFLTQFWKLGIKKKSNYAGVMQWQLRGSPWNSFDDIAGSARSMLCHLLELFGRDGWKLQVNVDVSGKYYRRNNSNTERVKIDTDTWFLVRHAIPVATPYQM